MLSDRICLLCLFDFNSFCISYYWMFSPNKKFYIWKDWQIILVYNWFCTDRASERITGCITCSWALLFWWEMLLINFSLLGVNLLLFQYFVFFLTLTRGFFGGEGDRWLLCFYFGYWQLKYQFYCWHFDLIVVTFMVRFGFFDNEICLRYC